MRNVWDVIPVLFNTVFAEDATNTAVEAHRNSVVCRAAMVDHARERFFIVVAEFGIIEKSLQVAASFKWLYTGKQTKRGLRAL